MNKKESIVILWLTIFLVCLPFVFSDQNIASCGMDLTSSNRYWLNQTITSSIGCLNISGDNITLDCIGYNIIFSTSGGVGDGIRIKGRDNITIKNCNIINGNLFSNPGLTGIKVAKDILNYSDNIVIETTAVILNASDATGIYLDNSSGVNITGSIINLSVETSRTNGIWGLSDANISNSVIRIYGNNTTAFMIYKTNSEANVKISSVTVDVRPSAVQTDVFKTVEPQSGITIRDSGVLCNGLACRITSFHGFQSTNVATINMSSNSLNNSGVGYNGVNSSSLNFNSTKNIVVDRNYIKVGAAAYATDAINVTNSSNINITRNTIEIVGGSRRASSIECDSVTEVLISENNIISNMTASIVLTKTRKANITNNNITQYGSMNSTEPVISFNGNNTNISYNNIRAHGYNTGIFLANGIEKARNISIFFNNISLNGSTVRAIYLENNTNGSLIHDNFINLSGYHPVGIGVNKSANVWVYHNNISAQVSDGRAIAIDSSDIDVYENYINMSGNTVFAPIVLTASNNTNITGNDIITTVITNQQEVLIEQMMNLSVYLNGLYVKIT